MKKVLLTLDENLIKEAKIMAIKKDMKFSEFIEFLIKNEMFKQQKKD